MDCIITAQAGALPLALAETEGARVVRLLEPGVALCVCDRLPPSPVFLRHACPAQAAVRLTGGEKDLEALEAACRPLLPALRPGMPFSVQTRLVGDARPAYARFDVNQRLSALALETGAPLDVRQPRQVLSVVLCADTGWLGVSPVGENYSAWAGGCRRFLREKDQVSRAEFKLLEALETFDVRLPASGTALDLGAAPGGWTRVLRGRGLSVVAVDPAGLDARVARDPGVTHVRTTAQAYFRAPAPCDIMVNDMKMDACQSAALMAEGTHCLSAGGVAVLTLKLPERPGEWPGRIRRARAVLSAAYRVEGMRQLFHNRNEATAYLTRL